VSQLRLFTDEDVHGAIAPQLRRRAIDTISAAEAGRLRIPDEHQLLWATSQGRVLLSFNRGHFVALHRDTLLRGDHHAGIIVSPQFSIGEVVNRMERLVAMLSAEQMQDRIEFLSNW
jgi:hypothetical protein